MQHGYPRSDPQETELINDQSGFHYLWVGVGGNSIHSMLGCVFSDDCKEKEKESRQEDTMKKNASNKALVQLIDVICNDWTQTQ